MNETFEMSFYEAPITNKIPLRTMGLVEVARTVGSTWLAPQTTALRAIVDVAEARRYKGWHFPYVTPAGVFSYCNDQSLVKHSGVLCMDLDHLEDVYGLKQQLIADKLFRTLMAFRQVPRKAEGVRLSSSRSSSLLMWWDRSTYCSSMKPWMP